MKYSVRESVNNEGLKVFEVIDNTTKKVEFNTFNEAQAMKVAINKGTEKHSDNFFSIHA